LLLLREKEIWKRKSKGFSFVVFRFMIFESASNEEKEIKLLEENDMLGIN
jgi:hypothetical protein